METWIKLYRKIVDSDIFQDDSAFKVFMWILCTVDQKTGSMKSGRFWAAERLGIKPITYYDILKRLEKKYKMVTLSSNNKMTTISVNKWEEYQHTSNTSGNNKVTTKQQQSNTTQEYKNKELKKEHSEYSDLTESDFEEISQKYGVPIPFTRSRYDDMGNWLKAKGRTYKNYYAALCNWVKSDAIKLKQGENSHARRISIIPIPD